MIEVTDLRRTFGTFEALKGISFRIGAGEIVGFLGPNGAGKSTTMRILTGFIPPTSGTARIGGHEVVADTLQARRQLGYLPESAPSYAEMRVRDYLDFIGRVRELPPSEREKAIDRAATECDLTDRLNQVIGTLSKGYKQRVGLAAAILHEPPVLILDEPTSGLDPNQIAVIRDLIRRIGARRTVILSTHIMQEVQAVCDRVLILSQGQLVADAPTDLLGEQALGGTMQRVTYLPGRVRLTPETVAERISGLPGVQRVTARAATQAEEPNAMSFEVLADRDVRAALFQLATQEGLVLIELGAEKSSLDEVFRRLTAS
ncbi:MAG: ATP-binding cassette domain-containing protein [Myxococcales bacterium]|nr:ATP-binding cassette domain-containing protein [Myxococcales bacterium]